MVFNSKSVAETQKFAQKLAGKFKKTGGIIALTGDLGTGKTIFAQGFAKGLGIQEKIISPTFILIRQYCIHKTKRTFYHMDLYRLDSLDDIKNLGIDEVLISPGNVVVIEWAEKIDKLLPKNSLRVNLKKTGGNSRLIAFN